MHAHTTHTVRLLKILVNWTFPSPVLQMANVSMWCLSEDPLNRPEMRDTMPALCQIHLASIEWEASLGGDGEVFSGVSYGRWIKRRSFGLHTPFQFYLKENGSCAAVCEFICWFLVRFWRVAFLLISSPCKSGVNAYMLSSLDLLATTICWGDAWKLEENHQSSQWPITVNLYCWMGRLPTSVVAVHQSCP